MAGNSWKIHKFGGSSLKDAACFSRVANILEAQEHSRIGVVVSAMGGMTDSLLRLTSLAERDNNAFLAELHQLGERYGEVAKQLVEKEDLIGLLDQWSADAGDIEDLLKNIAMVKSAPQRSRDVVAGYGELWSARLLAAHLARKLGSRARWYVA